MNHVLAILREPIVKIAVRATVLLFGLWMFYNKLDPRDIKTLLLCIFADSALSSLGHKRENVDS